jgi:AcrR family transcriptional regulator
MADKPTARRRYDATLRSERAAGTRQRILDAAKQFFTLRGVEKVSIADIAAAAGVSVPTIYALFQSKTGVLKAVVERSFFGVRYAEIEKRRKIPRRFCGSRPRYRGSSLTRSARKSASCAASRRCRPN